MIKVLPQITQIYTDFSVLICAICGKNSCTINLYEDIFEEKNCPGIKKYFCFN